MFLDMLTEFEMMSYGSSGCINVSKHRMSVIDDMVRPVYSTRYQEGSAAKKLAAMKLSKTLAEEAKELKTTNRPTAIVLSPQGKMDCCALPQLSTSKRCQDL